MKKSAIFLFLILFLSITQVYGVNFDKVVKNNKSDNSLFTKSKNNKPLFKRSKRFPEREIRIKKFITKNIIDRFKIFKGNVKLSSVIASEKVFSLTGRLVSPENKPMDLVGKFCEALENSKKFGVIIPSLIKKENVEEQNKVYFVLMVNGTDSKIKDSEIK